MKVDVYTKTVLTVIAICLSIQTLKTIDFFPKAYAAADESIEKNIPNTEYRLVPISETNTIDVRIVDINTYDELNVNLRGVDTREEIRVDISNISTTDELDVNIDEIGGGWINNGSPIPVVIKQ